MFVIHCVLSLQYKEFFGNFEAVAKQSLTTKLIQQKASQFLKTVLGSVKRPLAT